MLSEADTCRRFVVPKLQAAGWDSEPHEIREQVTFTDGRILVAGRKAERAVLAEVAKRLGVSRSAVLREGLRRMAVQLAER